MRRALLVALLLVGCASVDEGEANATCGTDSECEAECRADLRPDEDASVCAVDLTPVSEGEASEG